MLKKTNLNLLMSLVLGVAFLPGQMIARDALAKLRRTVNPEIAARMDALSPEQQDTLAKFIQDFEAVQQEIQPKVDAFLERNPQGLAVLSEITQHQYWTIVLSFAALSPEQVQQPSTDEDDVEPVDADQAPAAVDEVTEDADQDAEQA